MKLLLTLIGLILVLEAIPYVAAPEAMQRWLAYIQEIPPNQLRKVGLAAMAAGFLLCFLTQRSALFN